MSAGILPILRRFNHSHFRHILNAAAAKAVSEQFFLKNFGFEHSVSVQYETIKLGHSLKELFCFRRFSKIKQKLQFHYLSSRHLLRGIEPLPQTQIFQSLHLYFVLAGV